MKRLRQLKGPIGALALMGAVACGPDSPVAPAASDVSASFTNNPSSSQLWVCKVGLDAETVGDSFDFTASATGGTVDSEFSLIASATDAITSQCAVVWTDNSGASNIEVTITELVPAGYVIGGAAVLAGGAWTEVDVVNGSVTVTPAPGVNTKVAFGNQQGSEPVLGRMTGGGFQIRVDGARVTRGLTLHCDVTLSNNLEINWAGGNNWHLEKESLESVVCIDDPIYNPFPPVAPFDTFIARAIGSLNGVDGSIIDFKFIDDGEPGTSDEAHFTIYAPNAGPGQVAPGAEVIALEVGGVLDGGNLQAHYDQPHG